MYEQFHPLYNNEKKFWENKSNEFSNEYALSSRKKNIDHHFSYSYLSYLAIFASIK